MSRKGRGEITLNISEVRNDVCVFGDYVSGVHLATRTNECAEDLPQVVRRRGGGGGGRR